MTLADPVMIRPSTLPGYQDCARRAVARAYPRILAAAGHALRDTVPPVGAAVGTACHAGVAFTLTEKMTGGTLGNMTEAVQRGLQSFDDAAADGVTWDDTTPQPGAAHRQVERMVLTYRHVVAPAVQPVAVEQRLVATLARPDRDRPGFILSGQKDCRTREPNRIRDLKTGARRRVNTSQYGAYAMIEAAHGSPISEVVEDFIQRVRPDKPQPAPDSVALPAAGTAQLAWHVVQRLMADLIRFTETGDPAAFLANPNSALCSAKYCPAHGTSWCTEHRR